MRAAGLAVAQEGGRQVAVRAGGHVEGARRVQRHRRWRGQQSQRTALPHWQSTAHESKAQGADARRNGCHVARAGRPAGTSVWLRWSSVVLAWRARRRGTHAQCRARPRPVPARCVCVRAACARQRSVEGSPIAADLRSPCGRPDRRSPRRCARRRRGGWRSALPRSGWLLRCRQRSATFGVRALRPPLPTAAQRCRRMVQLRARG